MTRFSLEFAHTHLEAVNDGDVALSAHVAGRVSEAIVSAGHEVVTCVLVDDKRAMSVDREVALGKFLADIRYPAVDYICFESDLANYAEDLVELFDGRAKRRINRLIHDRLAKFGSLPCSVDIAIWHLLRLGILADSQCRVVAVHDDAASGFVTDVALSVLGDQMSDFEDNARRDLLRHVRSGSPIDRIFPVYYPENTAVSCPFVHLDDLLSTDLKEKIHAGHSDH